MKGTIIIILMCITVNIARSNYFQDQQPEYDTRTIETVYDLEFTNAERDSMQKGLTDDLRKYKALHEMELTNTVQSALVFNPIPQNFEMPGIQAELVFDFPEKVDLPKTETELAFFTVAQLSVLIREREITSTQLTRLYLDRLNKFGDTLECVITILEQEAMQKAAEADAEITNGIYRGPLHGIPYGVKDLFTLEGYKTTWGAMPYKDQFLPDSATVIKRLADAGAILIAKLTLGALAMGDVWYDGKTRNPWNMGQGSSGSSAGSGAATAAGLVAFAIGTETLGSIVSPSTRNGVSGLRPTFGRVSRAGAMALSWSMDKVGPMCRSANDCAIVLDAIYGSDGIDQSVIDAPFNYDAGMNIENLKIGYLKDLFERDYSNRENDSVTLSVLRSLGLELTPLQLPDSIPFDAMLIILTAESGAAFDQLTRSNKDDQLVRQDKGAWPNIFRTSRFIPAVEYIQANRLRYELIQEIDTLIRGYDAIISPSFGGAQLLVTNLTGHPVVVIPNGFNSTGGPTSITFIGQLFDEGTIIAIASAYQKATVFDNMYPPFFYE